MDEETMNYILDYYSGLLTDKERLAIKHTSSVIKLDLPNRSMNDTLVRVYKEKGWLTSDQSVLDLIQDGYPAFQLRVANRIIQEHSEQIKLNLCPQCKKLARTPFAKQCRYCGHDWH